VNDESPGVRAEILLVEDNPGDVRLTREALRDAEVTNTLRVVTDGEQAMSYLRRQGDHQDAVRPDLVLLDLNLPRKDGREVLAEMKQDPDLRRIPVVVLTTSQDDEDVSRTYDLHANCFVTKPVNLTDYMRVVHSIERFWFTVVRLPGA
jgi:chemotaxis family two-component system response regulator Rcp1